LRHYAPNIDSYLFDGQLLKEGSIALNDAVLIDFGGLLSRLNDNVKYYVDLSKKGSYLEAINQLYEVLRWAETREDAKTVLITNLHSVGTSEDAEGTEHRDALFDRIYRATSGQSV